MAMLISRQLPAIQRDTWHPTRPQSASMSSASRETCTVNVGGKTDSCQCETTDGACWIRRQATRGQAGHRRLLRRWHRRLITHHSKLHPRLDGGDFDLVALECVLEAIHVERHLVETYEASSSASSSILETIDCAAVSAIVSDAVSVVSKVSGLIGTALLKSSEGDTYPSICGQYKGLTIHFTQPHSARQ